MPQGAFYAFADCRALLGHSYAGRQVNSSLELSEALLETVKLAVVAGSAFGAEGYLRFSYSVAVKQIEEGIRRLAGFVAMRDG